MFFVMQAPRQTGQNDAMVSLDDDDDISCWWLCQCLLSSDQSRSRAVSRALNLQGVK